MDPRISCWLRTMFQSLTCTSKPGSAVEQTALYGTETQHVCQQPCQVLGTVQLTQGMSLRLLSIHGEDLGPRCCQTHACSKASTSATSA